MTKAFVVSVSVALVSAAVISLMVTLSLRESRGNPPPIDIIPGQPTTTLVHRAEALMIFEEWKRIDAMYCQDPHLFEYRAQDGNTILHIAAKRGSAKAVEIYLTRGASASMQNHERQTPFHMAAFNNRIQTIQAFLSSGVDINSIGTVESGVEFTVREPGGSALDWAAEAGAAESVELLLKSGAKLDSQPENRSYSALHHAMHFSGPTQTHLAKLDIESRESQQKPMSREPARPIPVAGNARVIDLLMEAGADLKNRNYKGEQPLHIVLTIGDPDTALYLLKNYSDRLDINAVVNRVRLPLDLAMSRVGRCLADETSRWNEVVERLQALGAVKHESLRPELKPPPSR